MHSSLAARSAANEIREHSIAAKLAIAQNINLRAGTYCVIVTLTLGIVTLIPGIVTSTPGMATVTHVIVTLTPGIVALTHGIATLTHGIVTSTHVTLYLLSELTAGV